MSYINLLLQMPNLMTNELLIMNYFTEPSFLPKKPYINLSAYSILKKSMLKDCFFIIKQNVIIFANNENKME